MWYAALDRIATKMVELVEKIEYEFRRKGYAQLGVLATYLCQILGKELDKKRVERENIKRKKRLFPIPENTQTTEPIQQDIYNKSMIGPHQ